MVRWDSTTDWEAAQDREGLTIREFAGRDHAIQLGPDPEWLDSLGCALYYSFDEDSGTPEPTIGSSSATVHGATLDAPGAVGTDGIEFDHSDEDRLDIDYSGTLVSGSFSISTVIYYDYQGAANATLARAGFTEANTFIFRIRQDNRFRLELYDSSGNFHALPQNLFPHGSTDSISDRLQHVLIYYDDSAGEVGAYLNGSDSHDSVSQSISFGNVTESLHLGSNPNGAQPYNGMLDEFMLFDRVLSESEADELATSYATGSLTTAAKSP